MKHNELEAKFREIVKKDTKLDEREQMALLDLYIELNDMAEIGMLEMARDASLKVTGAITLLMDLGKIRDDEDLHMLINEIEAEAYKAFGRAGA